MFGLLQPHDKSQSLYNDLWGVMDMDVDEIESKAEAMPWHLGVFDAHCHPTDTVQSFDNVPSMKAWALTIMASRRQDQSLVTQLAARYPYRGQEMCSADEPRFVIPAFGWHPWFSYQIHDDLNPHGEDVSPSQHFAKVISPSPAGDEAFLESLPEVLQLSDVLQKMRCGLEQFPLALVGEIGLDRAFRIPNSEFASPEAVENPSITPGGREGRGLSQYHVDIEHQKRILVAQLNLAGEYQRPVSVHGVAAHGVLFNTISSCWKGFERKNISKRAQRRETSLRNMPGLEENDGSDTQHKSSRQSLPFPPRICLHSYSGAPETLKQWLHPSVPAKMYFSFSKLVNFSAVAPKAVAVVQNLPDDRILVESDLHKAGDQMDDLLEEIVRVICMIKDWRLDNGIKILAANWKSFIFGESTKASVRRFQATLLQT